jgi:hypothetical protein
VRHGKSGHLRFPAGRRSGYQSLFLLLAVATCASTLSAGLPELRAEALRGFREYVAKAEARNQASLRQGDFLWVDDLSEQERNSHFAKLKQGEVVMQRVTGDAGEKAAEVPGGMIHDWRGIVFVPGAKLDQVLAVLQDYNDHATIYAPDVERSKIEAHDGDHFRVFMRFRRHKVVTVVLNTEQDITYFRDSPTQAHSRSTAIRIREVVNPGTQEEREKTPGEDNGFLWQMETWWRMEERDGGVYVQNEAISLTRDIPTGLGWLIEPFVISIPKETLEFTLGATRKAVLARETP